MIKRRTVSLVGRVPHFLPMGMFLIVIANRNESPSSTITWLWRCWEFQNSRSLSTSFTRKSYSIAPFSRVFWFCIWKRTEYRMEMQGGIWITTVYSWVLGWLSVHTVIRYSIFTTACSMGKQIMFNSFLNVYKSWVQPDRLSIPNFGSQSISHNCDIWLFG